MQNVLQVISRVGPSDANVLVLGENGTGKGVVARALHAVSSRASRPMVVVNSGGVSEGVFESELFGHVRGAFTDAKADRVGRFELADQGTLFLDEIANVPLSQQAKLLRVIETGEFERLGSSRTRRVDVRIISATNADLTEEVDGRPVPSGSALPPEHDRNPPAAAARPARRHCRCSPSTSCGSTRSAIASGSPASKAARCRCCSSTPGPATSASSITPIERAVLMAQGPLVKPGDLGLRDAPRRRRPPRGHEPRRRRVLPDQEGDDPLRRQRQPGRQGARPEPQRALPAAAALRPLKRLMARGSRLGRNHDLA